MAREFCSSKGGDLAVITSQLEMDVVIGHFNESVGRGTWLGGVYNGTIMSWQWINGEPWLFENLEEGQTFEDDERLTFRTRILSPERKWLSVGYDSIKYVLCERRL